MAIAFIAICSLSKPRFCSVKAFSLGIRVFDFVSDVVALFSTYRENMSPEKEQKRLPIENVAFKGEITFTERKRCLLTQQRVYRRNMYPTKATTRLRCYNVVRQCENAFIERKPGSQS